MKVLIVGKTGFIGNKLYERLIDNGFEVNYTIRPDEVDVTINPDAYSLELSETENFNFDVVNKNDVVIFLAAISSPDFCESHHKEAYEINVTGTTNFIFECGKRGAKVLFFSSDVVYGMPKEDQVFDEHSELNPFGKYAKMKAEVENTFKQSDWVKVFRLSYVFSRNDKFTTYLSNSCEKNEAAEIFDPFSRNVIYINDLLEGIEKVISHFDEIKPHTFNLCGPQLVSRKDMAEAFKLYHKNFSYNVVTPDESFFKARAKKIETHSLYLKDLLGRPPMTIQKAMELEFSESVAIIN